LVVRTIGSGSKLAKTKLEPDLVFAMVPVWVLVHPRLLK
jgi:hypothetical protein